MKTIILLGVLAMPPLAGTNAHGCEQGCEEHQGVCACYGTPEIAPSVKPSDEKPPRNQIPAWQSGEVVPDTRASLIFIDAEQDRKIKDADRAGKDAAGVPR